MNLREIREQADKRYVEVLRIYRQGMTYAALGRQLGVSGPRAAEMVREGERRERNRWERQAIVDEHYRKYVEDE